MECSAAWSRKKSVPSPTKSCWVVVPINKGAAQAGLNQGLFVSSSFSWRYKEVIGWGLTRNVTSAGLNMYPATISKVNAYTRPILVTTFTQRLILSLIFCLETILETIFNLAIIFWRNSLQNSLQMGNKPQNNPQKKVTKIVLVDAFTFSNTCIN